jgi:hypothetical protein
MKRQEEEITDEEGNRGWHAGWLEIGPAKKI